MVPSVRPCHAAGVPSFQTLGADFTLEEVQEEWRHATSTVQSLCVKEAELLAEAFILNPKQTSDEFAERLPSSFYSELYMCLARKQAEVWSSPEPALPTD
jgi:hypothetical protein